MFGHNLATTVSWDGDDFDPYQAKNLPLAPLLMKLIMRTKKLSTLSAKSWMTLWTMMKIMKNILMPTKEL